MRILYIILACLLWACGSGGQGYYQEGAMSISDSLELARPLEFVIKRHDGVALGQIETNEREVVIQYNKYRQRLIGQHRPPNSSPYINEKGDVIVSVNYIPEGLQLLDADEQLLWQLERRGLNLWIDSSPEMEDPFIIKTLNRQRFQVIRAEKNFGKCYRKKGKVYVKGEKTNLEIDQEQSHFAYATLLIEEIPLELRYVLLAELLYF